MQCVIPSAKQQAQQSHRQAARAVALSLPCWRGSLTGGDLTIEDLGGGLTNTNFVVCDRGEKFVVRVGDDVPVQHILRFNEHAASLAAERVGLSPSVVYRQTGALVLRHINGRTLTADEVRSPAMLPRILRLIQTCHREMPQQMRGAALAFWPFQSMRDYLWTLDEDADCRHAALLPEFRSVLTTLEEAVGPIRLVYGHNDLLAANLIDSGDRLWLIDWDYGGYGSPLFDLANLASNNGLAEEQERWLVETYFSAPAEGALWRSYRAMVAASLLREAMWSMVAERYSLIDFDYAAYTDRYLERFAAALALV